MDCCWPRKRIWRGTTTPEGLRRCDKGATTNGNDSTDENEDTEPPKSKKEKGAKMANVANMVSISCTAPVISSQNAMALNSDPTTAQTSQRELGPAHCSNWRHVENAEAKQLDSKQRKPVWQFSRVRRKSSWTPTPNQKTARPLWCPCQSLIVFQ